MTIERRPSQHAEVRTAARIVAQDIERIEKRIVANHRRTGELLNQLGSRLEATHNRNVRFELMKLKIEADQLRDSRAIAQRIAARFHPR